MVGNRGHSCCPPRGKSSSRNFATSGREKGCWRCLPITSTYRGMFPKGGGRVFFFDVAEEWEGRSHYFVLVYFGYVRT